MATANERVRLGAVFCDLLQGATKERTKRAEFVRVGDESVPGWVVYEQGKMLEAVNLARAARGLDPVTLGAIQRVERMAMGHVDYVTKFALYCSELVFN